MRRENHFVNNVTISQCPNARERRSFRKVQHRTLMNTHKITTSHRAAEQCTLQQEIHKKRLHDRRKRLELGSRVPSPGLMLYLHFGGVALVIEQQQGWSTFAAVSLCA